jgi:two-component system LytT family response regulator
VVVDDEAPARRRIRDLLADVDDIELVAECSDGAAAVAAIEVHRPHVLFLDVQMPELSGFDVLEVAGADAVPAVVFVSAFDQHAVEAFDRRALDYLLKPFTTERFEDTLERIRTTLRRRPDDLTARVEEVLAERRIATGRLPVGVDGGVRLVRFEDIRWVEADGNYTRVHTAAGEIRTRATLSSMHDRLRSAGFVRIHRSYVVNAAHVVELAPWTHGERTIRLVDGASLVSSRSYRDEVARLAGEDGEAG